MCLVMSWVRGWSGCGRPSEKGRRHRTHLSPDISHRKAQVVADRVCGGRGGVFSDTGAGMTQTAKRPFRASCQGLGIAPILVASGSFSGRPERCQDSTPSLRVRKSPGTAKAGTRLGNVEPESRPTLQPPHPPVAREQGERYRRAIRQRAWRGSSTNTLRRHRDGVWVCLNLRNGFREVGHGR